jgi:cystathionine beta-lyase
MQPGVREVYHPGFRNHPGRELHRRQAQGDGSVVTFTTGDAAVSTKLVEATKLFTIAVSFGSVGSTISLPCRMSHASIPQHLRRRLAPPADLVRLSVGIEDFGDLLEDLKRAFAIAEQERESLVTTAH